MAMWFPTQHDTFPMIETSPAVQNVNLEEFIIMMVARTLDKNQLVSPYNELSTCKLHMTSKFPATSCSTSLNITAYDISSTNWPFHWGSNSNYQSSHCKQRRYIYSHSLLMKNAYWFMHKFPRILNIENILPFLSWKNITVPADGLTP